MGCINQRPKKSNISNNNPYRGYADGSSNQPSNYLNKSNIKSLNQSKIQPHRSNINQTQNTGLPLTQSNQLGNSNNQNILPPLSNTNSQNTKGRLYGSKDLTVKIEDSFRNIDHKTNITSKFKQQQIQKQKEKENLTLGYYSNLSPQSKMKRNEDSDIKPQVGRIAGSIINESNSYLPNLNIPYPKPRFGWVAEICDEDYEVNKCNINIPSVKLHIN